MGGDWVWIVPAAALTGVLVQAGMIVAHYTRTGSTARQACELASEAKKIALDAHEKIEIANTATALHRERLAREMVNRDDIREWRDEIKEALRALTDRIDRAFQVPR